MGNEEIYGSYFHDWSKTRAWESREKINQKSGQFLTAEGDEFCQKSIFYIRNLFTVLVFCNSWMFISSWDLDWIWIVWSWDIRLFCFFAILEFKKFRNINIGRYPSKILENFQGSTSQSLFWCLDWKSSVFYMLFYFLVTYFSWF